MWGSLVFQRCVKRLMIRTFYVCVTSVAGYFGRWNLARSRLVYFLMCFAKKGGGLWRVKTSAKWVGRVKTLLAKVIGRVKTSAKGVGRVKTLAKGEGWIKTLVKEVGQVKELAKGESRHWPKDWRGTNFSSSLPSVTYSDKRMNSTFSCQESPYCTLFPHSCWTFLGLWAV